MTLCAYEPFRLRDPLLRNKNSSSPSRHTKVKQLRFNVMCPMGYYSKEQLFGVVGCGEGVVYHVHLVLAYSWARPAILVAGKGRGILLLFLLFLHVDFCSSFFLSLSFISSTISSISFLPFSGRQHKMTHKSWRVVKPQHNQSKKKHNLAFEVFSAIIYKSKCDP